MGDDTTEHSSSSTGERVPILNYARPERRKPRYLLVVFLVTLGATAVVAVLFSAPCCPAREPANRARCNANVRQIGLAILVYARENDGALPDSLTTLFLTQDLTPEVFICRSSDDTRAGGATRQKIAAKMLQPGHVSYIYTGAGLTLDDVDDKTIILYEPATNHGRDGAHVLFSDAIVEWWTAAEFNVWLADQARKVE